MEPCWRLRRRGSRGLSASVLVEVVAEEGRLRGMGLWSGEHERALQRLREALGV